MNNTNHKENCPKYSLSDILALDGRIEQMLSDKERSILSFYYERSRKFGVGIRIISDIAPDVLAQAKSKKAADALSRNANRMISVDVNGQ